MEKPNCKRPTKTSTTPAHVGKAKPAARAAWAGFLRLGALVCPARAFSATSTGADIELHLVHRDCGERIRCPRQCPVHGAIDSAEIVKAIEVSPGQHLLPDESDLQKLNPPKDEELHLVRFVAADEFDPLLYNGTHLYLQPKASTAEFSAIVATLTRLRRHGIGTLNFNGRRHLVAVAARSGLLIVHSLHYPELLRAVPDCFSPPTTELTHRNAAAEKVANAKKNRVDWDGYCDPAPEIMRRILANASKKNGRSERVRLPRQQVTASSKKTSVEAKRSNRGPQSGVRA